MTDKTTHSSPVEVTDETTCSTQFATTDEIAQHSTDQSSYPTDKIHYIEPSDKYLASKPTPASDKYPAPEQSKIPLEPDNVEATKSHCDREHMHIPFTLPLWLFAVVIATITTIAVGAIIGASLGATLNSCHKSLNNAKADPFCTTNSLSNFSVTTPVQIKSLQNTYCSQQSPSEVTTLQDRKFTVMCGGAIELINGTVTIMSMLSYTFDDCVQACANINTYWTWDYCSGISWNQALNSSLQVEDSYGSNCWLYTNTTNGVISKRDNYTAAFVSL